MRKATKSVKPLGGVRDPRHGTAGGFGYWGCTCGKCRQAARDAQKFYRNQPVTSHGVTGARRGCECDICTTAMDAKTQRDSSAKRRRTRLYQTGEVVELGGLA